MTQFPPEEPPRFSTPATAADTRGRGRAELTLTQWEPKDEGERRGQSGPQLCWTLWGMLPATITATRVEKNQHREMEEIKTHPALHPKSARVLAVEHCSPHPGAPPSRGGAGLVLCVLLEPRRLNLEPSSCPSSAINLPAGVTDLVPIFQLLFRRPRGDTQGHCVSPAAAEWPFHHRGIGWC